jgi:hypothetical protein
MPAQLPPACWPVKDEAHRTAGQGAAAAQAHAQHSLQAHLLKDALHQSRCRAAVAQDRAAQGACSKRHRPFVRQGMAWHHALSLC